MLQTLLDASPIAILSVILLIIVYTGSEAYKKWYRRTETGERRQLPIIMKCPNDLPGLAATMGAISGNMAISHTDQLATQKVSLETVRILEKVAAGIGRLEVTHSDIHGDAIVSGLGKINNIGIGVERLVKQHEPGADGRETWKESTRAETVREESRDLLIQIDKTMTKMLRFLENGGKNRMRFCIDPGHGGADPGAIGPTGLTEANAALGIARYVRRGLLELEHDVLCTRADDRAVSLPARCHIANDWSADVLLSIHCNAFSNPMAHGFEVWTSRGDTDADPIAEKIFNSLQGAFPMLTPRFDMTDGDHDKESGFKVLVGTRMPAVLVECAFISNALEERWLSDIGWRMRMAGAMVSAL